MEQSHQRKPKSEPSDLKSWGKGDLKVMVRKQEPEIRGEQNQRRQQWTGVQSPTETV